MARPTCRVSRPQTTPSFSPRLGSPRAVAPLQRCQNAHPLAEARAPAERLLKRAASTLGFAVALIQASCGSPLRTNVPPVDHHASADGPRGDAPDAAESEQKYPLDPAAAELCRRPGTLAEVKDPGQFRELVAGRWLRCGPPLWPSAHAGIEFAEDGTFRLLFRRRGELVAGSGLDAEGTWDFLGMKAPFQLNVTRDGTHISHPRFTKDPVKMRLLGTDIVPHDFVRLDPVPEHIQWSPPGKTSPSADVRLLPGTQEPMLVKLPVPATPPPHELSSSGAPARQPPSTERCALGPEADASFDPGPDVVIARLRYAKHKMTLNSFPGTYIFDVGLDITEVLAGAARPGPLRTSYMESATEMPKLPVGQKVVVELRKRFDDVLVAAFSELAQAGEVLKRRDQKIAAQHQERTSCERLQQELASADGAALVTSRNVKDVTVSFHMQERAERRAFRVVASTSDGLAIGSERRWKTIEPLRMPALRCFLLSYDKVGSEYVTRTVWQPTASVLSFASKHRTFGGSLRCPQ